MELLEIGKQRSIPGLLIFTKSGKLRKGMFWGGTRINLLASRCNTCPLAPLLATATTFLQPGRPTEERRRAEGGKLNSVSRGGKCRRKENVPLSRVIDAD